MIRLHSRACSFSVLLFAALAANSASVSAQLVVAAEEGMALKSEIESGIGALEAGLDRYISRRESKYLPNSQEAENLALEAERYAMRELPVIHRKVEEAVSLGKISVSEGNAMIEKATAAVLKPRTINFTKIHSYVTDVEVPGFWSMKTKPTYNSIVQTHSRPVLSQEGARNLSYTGNLRALANKSEESRAVKSVLSFFDTLNKRAPAGTAASQTVEVSRSELEHLQGAFHTFAKALGAL